VQTAGWAGVVIGIVLILVAIFAEQLGLGGATFGIRHILTLAVGIVLVGAGALVAMRSRPAASGDTPQTPGA
jgi:hypothetical protein